MDTGEGQFQMFDTIEEDLQELRKKYPKHGGVFKVGEEITIRDSVFRIKSIKPKELRLKLMRKK